MPTFIERHQDKIQGVLSCFDRILITGTLPQICYAAGMTAFLYQKSIRIFDYARWAEPLRDEIRANAEKLAIKMYDKYAIVLRIETTSNDISFFKHHRKVEHRDGTYAMKVAPLKKSIYSLPALVRKMADANQRYLEFISAIDDPSCSIRDLNKISKPASDANRTYRGFNLFLNDDLDVFYSIIRGEFNISGFKNRDLKTRLTSKSSGQISRILKRLHKHGLIKKIAKTYKYYLTTFGHRIVATALKLREMFIIPYLRGVLAAQV